MSNPNKSYFDKYTDPVVREIDKVNIYEFENGMDYELTISGKPINVDTIKEAQNKVLKNLKKDPTFYTNMLVNETIKMVGEYGSGKKPGVRSTAKSAESVKKDGKMPKASKQDAPFGGKDEVKGKYKSSGMEPAKKVPGSLNESKQIKESFKSLEKKLEKKITIYNASENNLDWFTNSGWGKRIDLLNLEFDKIEKYQKFDHLASFTDAIKYFEWRELNMKN